VKAAGSPYNNNCSLGETRVRRFSPIFRLVSLEANMSGASLTYFFRFKAKKIPNFFAPKRKKFPIFSLSFAFSTLCETRLLYWWETNEFRTKSLPLSFQNKLPPPLPPRLKTELYRFHTYFFWGGGTGEGTGACMEQYTIGFRGICYQWMTFSNIDKNAGAEMSLFMV
jgi:hypothetical protein